MTWFSRKNPEWLRIYDAGLITIAFLVVCWALYLLQFELGFDHINRWGLRPRESKGLLGILSMHFLHGSLSHIANNTFSFIVLNMMLFYFYRKIGLKVLLWTALAGAALLWLWGRQSNHIGASLVIFGITGFLFFSGVFRSDQRALRVSLLVAFWYGGIVWGIFPIDPSKSWEGHASGLFMGILLAFIYRNQGPQRAKYQWELDEEREAQEKQEEEKRMLEEALERLEETPGFDASDDTSGADVRYTYTPRKPRRPEDLN